MTLHRWHEYECGVSAWNGDTVCIERRESDGKPFYHFSATGRRTPTADRETPALGRLATIMDGYPGLSYYIQTDPRGASVFILRPGDVPVGEDPSAYYSRGLAVYK